MFSEYLKHLVKSLASFYVFFVYADSKAFFSMSNGQQAPIRYTFSKFAVFPKPSVLAISSNQKHKTKKFQSIQRYGHLSVEPRSKSYLIKIPSNKNSQVRSLFVQYCLYNLTSVIIKLLTKQHFQNAAMSQPTFQTVSHLIGPQPNIFKEENTL